MRLNTLPELDFKCTKVICQCHVKKDSATSAKDGIPVDVRHPSIDFDTPWHSEGWCRQAGYFDRPGEVIEIACALRRRWFFVIRNLCMTES